MNKKLTAIVMSSAIGLSALVGGCKQPLESKNIPGIAKLAGTVQLPENYEGEIINVGLYRSGFGPQIEYVVSKNPDGSISMYIKECNKDSWVERKYQK